MKKLLFIWLGLACMLFASCQSDKKEEGYTPTKKNGFTLHFSVPGTILNTYASIPSEEGEDQINTLYVLFFESTGSGTGKFVDYYQVTEGLPFSSSGTMEIDFSKVPSLDNETDYNILVVANPEGYLSTTPLVWLQSLTGKTESEVIQNTQSIVQGAANNNESDNSKAVRSDNQLMSARVYKEAEQEKVTVEFIRAMARFDVINNTIGYELVSASIWNAYPETTVWENNNTTFDKSRIKRYYGYLAQSSDMNNIKGKLYAFENRSLSPSQNDQTTTCLILGMRPYGGTTTYYRVNISSTADGQWLKRNNIYQISIKSVSKEGAGNELGAYNDSKMNLELNINGWDVDDAGLVLRDGDNIMVIPTSRIRFTPEADERYYSVYTIGTGTLEISRRELPQGITVSLNGNNFTVKADASNTYKEGFFELKFGNLVGRITVTQTGEYANSLSLSASEVPPFSANGATQMPGSIVVTSSGSWSAKMVVGDFTFQYGANVTEIKSAPSGQSFVVSTKASNNSAEAKIGVILVTLDSDPENFQRAIVLTQMGQGGFTVSPVQSTIKFDAEGTLIAGSANKNEFTVAPASSSDIWEAVLQGADADKFTITHDGGGSSVTGTGKFTVTAKGPNTGSLERTANVRVQFKNNTTVYKEMKVTQACYTLSLSPATVSAISSLGGSTPAITVTTSAPSSYRWTATVATANTISGHAAYFNQSQGSTSLTGRPLTEKFNVTFPRLTASGVSPVATVTVKLEGTDITASLKVNQESFQFNTKVTLKTAITTYYSSIYSPSDKYYCFFNRWGDNLRNSNYFSITNQNATVQIPSVSNWTAGWSVHDTNPDIFFANAEAHRGGRESDSRYISTPAQFNAWRLASDKRVLMIEGSWYGDQVLVSTGVAPAYKGTATSAGIGFSYSDWKDGCAAAAATIRSVNPNTKVRNTQLWKYLFEEGPFGPVNPSNLRLRSADATYGHISKWPTTMIPILFVKYGSTMRCVFGIDPTNRVIWIGDAELFSTRGGACVNYPGISGDNERFLNNVLAYMLNVVQFGDTFNSQFKPTNGPFTYY